jgi:hypothetical protein
MWIRRHTVRAGIYAALLLSVLLLFLFAGAIATWLIRGPAGRTVAAHFGVSLRVADARVGLNATELTGIDAVIAGMPPVQAKAGRLRIALPSIHATGLVFGETLTAADAAIELAGSSANVRGIQFANAVNIAQGRATFSGPPRVEAREISGFGARIDSAAAGSLQLVHDEVRVESADVNGVHIPSARELEKAAALAPAARQLAQDGDTLRALYGRLIPRLRDLLFWAILIAAVLIAGLKLLLTHAAPVLRVVSALAVLPAPFVFHRFGFYPVLAALAAVALALFVIIYLRNGREWHEKAEPLAVDLLGPALLALLLIGYGLTLPALPDAPRTFRLGQARVTNFSAVIGETSVTAPQITVTDVLAAQAVEVARVAVADIHASGPGWRVELPEVTATAVKAAPNAASVRQVDFRGEAESDLLMRQLARYEYLPAQFRRELRVSFKGNAAAGAPPLRYSGESTIRAQGIRASVRAEGDAGAVRITHLRTSPPSEVQIASGVASVPLALGGASTAHIAGLAVRGFSAGELNLKIKPGVAEANLRTIQLPNVRIDNILADAAYSRDAVKLSASASNLAFRLQDGRISGDIPQAGVRVGATRRSDLLSGEVRLTSNRIAADPLRFSADLRAGSFDIAEQALRIKQSIVPRAPETIAAQLRLAAKLSSGGPSADLRLRVPSIQPDVEPLGLELNGIDIAAALSQKTSRVSLETGWNRVRFPEIPQPNRLETIDRLQLSMRLKGDLFDPALLEGWRAPEIPAVPEQFRVSGVWPDLRIVTDTGQEIVTGGSVFTINRLAVPQSRVQALEFDFALRDIKTRVALAEEFTNIEVSGSFPGAPRFEFVAKPGRLSVSVPRFRPEIAGFEGAISGLRADVQYAPGRIETVAGSLTLDGGPLFRSDDAHVELGAPATVRFALNRKGAAAEIAVPALSAGVRKVSAAGSFETAVRLIHTTQPAAILEAFQAAADTASPHYRRARELLGPFPAAEYHVAARQSRGNPFLRIGTDRMELRGSFEAGSFKTGDVAADLVERERNLFLDAAVPVESRVFPVLVAIRSPFLLDDANDVQKIWAGFQPRHAPRGDPFVDRVSAELRGVSILQIKAPVRPVTAVVGLGERIQFHAPLAARLLFGSIAATAQGELAWNGNTPEITARVSGGFENLQAGALGLASFGSHQPFVEDAFDGSFRASLKDLPLTRESLERWRRSPANFDQYHRLTFALHATRSKTQAGPGTVQLGIDARPRILNEIVQRATDSIRFKVPPQLLTYRGLTASIDAANGMVQTKSPVLELSGVKILTTGLLDVNADVRVRLGDRLAAEMPLSHLVRSATGGEQ